jgi:hypothetical protein
VSIYTKANTWLISNINSNHIRFNIFNIIHITILVFHKHYYDDVAQVKCSLSRSDGDSNRFLTSWWNILHTNHTHSLKWATGHHWHYFGKVMVSTRTTIPRGHPTARNQAHPTLGLTLRVPIILIQIQYGALSRSIPDPNRVTSFVVRATYPAS